MKKLTTLLLLLIAGIAGIAQNSNVRAQGNYYSAKTNFQNGNYTEALNYVNKSKTGLGGTNYQLQYLHILTAYRLNKHEEAAKELQTYFDIDEKKTKAVHFDKSVDELTADETKELTKLIDPILESVEQRKASPCSRCEGTGQMIKAYTCSDCNGKGHLQTDCARNRENYTCDDGKVECQCNACGTGGGCACINGWHYCTHVGNIRCKTCKGSGKINCNNCSGVGYIKKDCAKCDNTGKIQSSTEKETCSKCRGKGF